MGTDHVERSGDVSPLLDLPSRTDSSVLVAPVDVLLQQEFRALNELLTHYLSMLSGADHGQAETVSVVAELALAASLTAAANAIRTRAERRMRLEDADAPNVTQASDNQPGDGATGTEGA
jgi:hypothetical protein